MSHSIWCDCTAGRGPCDCEFGKKVQSSFAAPTGLAVDAAMRDVSATAERLKAAGAMSAYYATNRLWWELCKERDRLKRDTANESSSGAPASEPKI